MGWAYRRARKFFQSSAPIRRLAVRYLSLDDVRSSAPREMKQKVLFVIYVLGFSLELLREKSRYPTNGFPPVPT